MLAQKARIYVAAVDTVLEVHEEAVERLARAEIVELRAYESRCEVAISFKVHDHDDESARASTRLGRTHSEGRSGRERGEDVPCRGSRGSECATLARSGRTAAGEG